MEGQANLYQEMAATLTQLSEGKDTEAGIQKLAEQVSTFQELRANAAELPHPTEEEALHLSQLPGQQEARDAFFKAQSALASSEYNSPKVFDILSGLHESVPVKGEGKL